MALGPLHTSSRSRERAPISRGRPSQLSWCSICTATAYSGAATAAIRRHRDPDLRRRSLAESKTTNASHSGVAFAEELLPGLDIIPTATIGWLLENTQFGEGVRRHARLI